MGDGAELRAVTSAGESYDDPSEDALFLLLEDLREDGDHVVVDRIDDHRPDTYMQVMRSGAGYVAERRAGSPESHEHASADDMRMVHEDLTTWAFGVNRRDRLDWRPGYGV